MARTHRFVIALMVAATIAFGLGVARADDGDAGSQAYRAIADSIVRVETVSGHGTGFVMDTEGHVMTNFHVILMPGPLAVNFNTLGDKHDLTLRQVTIVGVHPTYDLALLKVELPRGVKSTPATLADALPAVDTPVFAVGHPGSRSGVLANAVTGGVVVDPESKQDGGTFVKNTAAINPGNSGGPLVTTDGVVVGINTFFRKDSEVADFYAVPATAAGDLSVFVPIAQRTRQTEIAAQYKGPALEHLAAGRKQPAGQMFFYAMIWDPRDPDLYIGYIESGAAARSKTTTMAILEHVMVVAPDAEARVCLAIANTIPRADKRREPLLRRGLESKTTGAEDCARAIIADMYAIGDPVQQAYLYGVVAARSESSKDQRFFDKALGRCSPQQAAEVRDLLAAWSAEEEVADLPWQLVEQPDLAIRAPAWGSIAGPGQEPAISVADAPETSSDVRVQRLETPGLRSVAVMPDGRAYLAYADSSVIEVRSLPELEVVDHLAVARLPVHLSRLGHLLLIAESQSRQIAVYNTRSQRMEMLIPTEREPYRVDGDPMTLNLAVAMLPAKPLLLSLNAQRPHGDLRILRADPADPQRPAGAVYPMGKSGRIFWSATRPVAADQLSAPLFRIGDTDEYVIGKGAAASVRIDGRTGAELGSFSESPGVIVAVPEHSSSGVFYRPAHGDGAAFVVYDMAAQLIRHVAVMPSDSGFAGDPGARAATVFSPEAQLLLQVGDGELRVYHIGGGE